MGKMKEVFIKDIEDNAQHITYDMLDHRDHIDDDYHYCKHLQKKAMKQFNNTLKTLSLVVSMLLTTISYGQDRNCYCISDDGTYSFTVEYDELGVNSSHVAEGFPITWGFYPSVPVHTTYWKVSRDHDGYQYNDLSEYDNKPYVQLDVNGYGMYNFELFNSETDESMGGGSLILERP